MIELMVLYFFVSWEKFNFMHFCEEIELVGKNPVFFGRGKKVTFEIELVSVVLTFPEKKRKK